MYGRTQYTSLYGELIYGVDTNDTDVVVAALRT